MTAKRTITRLRKFCLSLPESSEVEAWGHPTFRAGKIFAILSDHEDRPCCSLKSTLPQQQLMITDPRFFVPPYVGKAGWIGVYLDADVDWDLIEELVLESYKHIALKRMLKQLG